MKRLYRSILTVALILSLKAGIATAQNSGGSSGSTSLGDLARQLKAQRAKSEEAPKVITNDDLTSPSPTGNGLTAAGPANAVGAPSSGETHGERYFRDRRNKLEERLQTDQRELDVLQQKLSLARMDFYSNPNKGLYQQSGPTALADVHKLQDEVTLKQVELAADQKAIDDLRGQLRREGGDPGWLREGVLEGKESETGQATTNSESTEAKRGTKDYWQIKFKSARARLASAKEQQQLAEDELNLLQIQQVRALDSNLKAELTDRINAKEVEVEKKRAAADAAQKALDELQKEFKDSGALDEWSQ